MPLYAHADCCNVVGISACAASEVDEVVRMNSKTHRRTQVENLSIGFWSDRVSIAPLQIAAIRSRHQEGIHETTRK